MNIYKVYAKGCISSRPVQKLERKEALEMAMEATINDFLDTYSEDDEKKINETIDKVGRVVTDMFDNEETINCGDWCITFSEESPERPGNCGYDTGYIKTRI